MDVYLAVDIGTVDNGDGAIVDEATIDITVDEF